MSDEHTSSRPILPVAATPEVCIPLKDNQFIKPLFELIVSELLPLFHVH